MIEYYQSGVNAPGYTLEWMENEDHACPYAYNHDAWDFFSGGAPDPYAPTLPKHCIELFDVNPVTGRMAQSLAGSPYDPRRRAWYISTKAIVSTRWSDMYETTPAHAAVVCGPFG